MKATILMKIAVVFMAAFGAYAFSGSASSQMFTRSDTCENIIAECDPSGTASCTIQIGSNKLPVLDTYCSNEVKHVNSEPVNWY